MGLAIVPAGEGERVSEMVQILVGREQLVITESLYPEGESGPGPHVHHHHADCFYVLEGDLVFEVGPELARREAAPGTFIHVPPEVVHTFRNEGPGSARFLNIHAPGCYFDETMRARRDGRDGDGRFDTDDPPEDGGRPAEEVLVAAPGDAGLLVEGPFVQVARRTLDGGLPGASLPEAPPAGVQNLYVLDGTVALRHDGSDRELRQNGFAGSGPGAGIELVPTGSPARVLAITAPVSGDAPPS